MPAMVAVGQAWAGGHLDVAQEHFLSAAVMRRLAAAYDAAGHARAARHVLTGLAPGATHQIATLAFATMLRRAGLRVTYLGPDLPVPSWVQAVRTTHPDAIVTAPPQPTTPQQRPTSSTPCTPCTRHPNTPPSTSAAPAHHPNKPPAAPPSPGPPTGSPTPSPAPPPHAPPE